MRVSDLAKQYSVSSQDVLSELKSLKLKAKDSKQELSSAAIAVVKRALEKKGKKFVPVKEEPVKTKSEAKSVLKPKSKKIKEEKDVKVKKEKKTKVVKVDKTKTVKKSVKKVAAKKPLKKENAVVSVKKSVSKKTKEKVVDKKKTKLSEEPEKKPSVQTVKDPEVKKVEPTVVEKKEIPPVVQRIMRPSGQRHNFFRGHRPRRGRKSFSRAAVKPDLGEPVVIEGPTKEIEIDFPINVKDLSLKIQQKTSIILKALMQKGIFATINQGLSEEIIDKVLTDLNFSYTKAKTQEEQLVQFHEQEDPSLLSARPPVVTFMGHVDHGKTSLLDQVRKSNVTDKEHGGITQHMAAYSVKTPRGVIAFLDTPGHAAFTSMRARGAHITDLVILVVAADDGVMPQTEEAIDHARAADVPIVVAINKIDKKNADIDKVKKQLSEKGLASEDWGGKTVVVGVSAITGEGIESLLEMILLESELLELKANHNKPASGIVVEAHLSHGKGSVASVIVQSGTLKDGDMIVAGPHFGKIKAMFDDHKKLVKVASPATPVEVLGLSGVPEAGEIFYVVGDEKQAKEIAQKRLEQAKDKRLHAAQKITLEDLYSQIQEGKVKDLNIIVKADVQGSLEALKESFTNMSTQEVQIKFIHTGIGNITAADVILAGVSNAIIVGFHVDTDVKAKEELEKQVIDVRTYRIIYDAVDDIRKALSGLLAPRIKKNFVGRVEIRQVLRLTKSGIIAGSFVQKGKITRKSKISLLRNGEEVFSGEIESLKRFKDDVREVREGFECGISIKGYDELQAGDIIEAYELEEIKREL